MEPRTGLELVESRPGLEQGRLETGVELELPVWLAPEPGLAPACPARGQAPETELKLRKCDRGRGKGLTRRR